LQSLIFQTEQDFDVLIIDDSDAPIDLRKDHVCAYLFKMLDIERPRWSVIFGEKKGCHYTHQLALNMAKTEWILNIDDDSIAHPDYIKELVNTAEFKKSENVGSVGGLVITPPPSVILDKEALLRSSKVMSNGDTDSAVQWCLHKYPKLIEVEHLHCSYLYNVKAAKEIGGFYLGFSKVAHREETDFNYRLFKAGYKLFVNPKAVLYHLKAPTGGIRSFSESESNYANDDAIWKARFRRLNNGSKKSIAIKVDGGIGDHIWAISAIKNFIARKPEGNVDVFACYHFVFAADGITTKQYSELNPANYDELHTPNIYKWAIDSGYTGTLRDAWNIMLNSKMDEPDFNWQSSAVKNIEKPFVLVAPYAGNNITSGNTFKTTPKNWQTKKWEALLEALPQRNVVQIGRTNETPLYGAKFLADLDFTQVIWLLQNCQYWISVDNFIPHLAATLNKKGIALFTCSDSNIFGNAENLNVQGKRDCSQICHDGEALQHQWRVHNNSCENRVCAESIKVEDILDLVKCLQLQA